MDRMKKREFRELTQGKRLWMHIRREFLDLSRYAEDDVSTDAKKQEKFREGLHPDIQACTLLFKTFTDFATLVNKAIYETSQNKHKEMLKRTETWAHLRARQVRSAGSGSRTMCTVKLPLHQGPHMLHHVRLHHQDGPILAGPSNDMAPLTQRRHASSVASPGHFARDCRQDQKQLALPSTGRGYTPAPQLQYQAVNLRSWSS